MPACESHAAVTFNGGQRSKCSTLFAFAVRMPVMVSVNKADWHYHYCVICRSNHNERRTHIFTTKHKTQLAAVLGKFSKKVRSARRLLQKPNVVEGELEPGVCVWCYCCQQEVEKHVTDRQVTIEWGGLLEHMASTGHHRKTRHFWWVNGANRNQMQMYLIFSAEYQRFRSLVAEALKKVEAVKEERVRKVAEEMRAKEELQSLAAMEPPLPPPPPPPPVYHTVENTHGVVQNPTGWSDGQRVWGGGIVKYRPGSRQLLTWPIDSIDQRPTATLPQEQPGARFTVAAIADNLTFVAPQSLEAGEGNVHSGATPPWLREEDSDDDTSTMPIGPSLDDFLKHKERLSHAGKNPKRVGADFHRKLAKLSQEEEEKWLPAFGRVWNPGPRSRSLVEFRREMNVERNRALKMETVPHKAADSSSTRNSPSTEVDTPTTQVCGGSGEEQRNSLPHIKPYVRRRPAKLSP